MGTTNPFYTQMATVADQLIELYGMQCSLRRGGADRTCWAAVYEYHPKDAASQLANPTDRAVIISAGLGDVPTSPPDWERDKLVTYVQPAGAVIDEILLFAMPLQPVRPAGIIVTYLGTVRR